MTVLERLYIRRLELDRARAVINKQIASLERRGAFMAGFKIHHATDGCSRPRLSNRHKGAHKKTKDWKLVDCLSCHHFRGKRRNKNKRKPRVPWKDSP